MQVKSASHRNAERRRQLEAPLSTPAVGWLSTEVAHSYKCLHSTKISLCLRPSQLHILTCHHSSVKLYHFGECLWIRELHQPHVSQNWQKKMSGAACVRSWPNLYFLLLSEAGGCLALSQIVPRSRAKWPGFECCVPLYSGHYNKVKKWYLTCEREACKKITSRY